MTRPNTTSIKFNGPMVRALIEGRKSQTRRPITRRNSTFGGGKWPNWVGSGAFAWDEALPDLALGAPDCPCLHLPWPDEGTTHRVRPKWEVGDLLWVKETWARLGPRITYRADLSDDEDSQRAFCWTRRDEMPMAASRLTLEVLDIRAERIQAISEEDAQAEGVEPCDCEGCHDDGQCRQAGRGPSCSTYMGGYRRAFGRVWDEIYAKRGHGWDTNPWVWAIRFRLHHENVDSVLRRMKEAA